MKEPRLDPDVWLTQQLGKPSFHLSGNIGQSRQLRAIAGKLSTTPLFADFKVPVSDLAAVAAAQQLGFALIETSLQFVLPRAGAPKGSAVNIGFATPDMADAVGLIAAHSFVHDRFHCDPAIADDVADALKSCWAKNFFAKKRGDWMVVAYEGGRPVGFLQLLLRADRALVIDLIAVAAAQRGRGLAGAMIAFACHNCEFAGPIVVATQAGNVASVRLYEKIGFRLEAARYLFHHHGLQC